MAEFMNRWMCQLLCCGLCLGLGAAWSQTKQWVDPMRPDGAKASALGAGQEAMGGSQAPVSPPGSVADAPSAPSPQQAATLAPKTVQGLASIVWREKGQSQALLDGKWLTVGQSSARGKILRIDRAGVWLRTAEQARQWLPLNGDLSQAAATQTIQIKWITPK
jgi:hypothetical protein